MIDTSPAEIYVLSNAVVWIVRAGAITQLSTDEVILLARRQYDSQVASLDDALDALCASGAYVRSLMWDKDSIAAHLERLGFTYVTADVALTPEDVAKAMSAADALRHSNPFSAAIASSRVRTDVPEQLGNIPNYVTTESPQPAGVFVKPAFVMDKVTPVEFLTQLRGRLNQTYMPSATGEVKFNSKPSYYHGVDGWVNDPKRHWTDGTGCYVDESTPYVDNNKRTIWAYVKFTDSQVETLCNLQTDQLWVRLLNYDNPTPWLVWTLPVAINRLTWEDEFYL